MSSREFINRGDYIYIDNDNTDVTRVPFNVSELLQSDFIDNIANPLNKTVEVNNPNKAKEKVYFVTVFLIISFLSVLINLRVLCIVSGAKGRKLKPASLLTAHLSSIAIILTFLLVEYIAESFRVVSVNGAGVCEVLSFLRNTIHSAFPLNVVGIIYERTRMFRMTLGQLLVYRSIVLIWAVAILGSFPSLLSMKYKETDAGSGAGKCEQIPLLGNFSLTLFYEVGRFLIFHLAVACYMFYALYNIRSKLRYLYILKPIPNDKIRRKVQRIRYVLVHSVVFIFTWLPIGLMLCIFKILSRHSNADKYNKLLAALSFLHFIFVIANPLIYLYLSEDLSQVRFFALDLCRCLHSDKNVKTTSESSEGELERNGVEHNNQNDSTCVHPDDKEKVTRGKCSRGKGRRSSSESRRKQETSLFSEMSRISSVAFSATSDISISVFFNKPTASLSEALDSQQSQQSEDEIIVETIV